LNDSGSAHAFQKKRTQPGETPKAMRPDAWRIRFAVLGMLLCETATAPDNAPVFTISDERVVATNAELSSLATVAPNWPDFPVMASRLDNANPPHYAFLATGAEGTRDNGLNSPGMMRGTLDHIVSGGFLYASPVVDRVTGRRLVPREGFDPAGYQYAGGSFTYFDPASGRTLLFTHLERHLGNDFNKFYSTLGLSISPSGGKHEWHFLGEIITPTVPYAEWKKTIEADATLPTGAD